MKLLAQSGILRCNPHRAGIEMALAHHDATQRDQRRCGKANFFSPQQRANHHVPTGLDAAVGLQRHPASQVIHHQRLVRLGKTQLPGQSRVLDTGQR